MIQYFLYRIGIWISINFPLKLSYKIASFIAFFQYKICSKDRIAVIGNLKAILDTNDEKLLQITAKNVFINFAKYLVDFFRFSLIDKQYIEKFIKIEGVENLLAAKMRGRGIIALTGHTGNWELAGVVTAYLGYSVNVIALNHKDSRVNDFFVKQRESKGLKVVPLGAAVKKCFVALKNNELIGVLGDRDFTGYGIDTNFLGKKVKLPKGAAVFSIKTGAVILPTFMIRQKDDSYRLIYQKPIEYVLTANEEEDVKTLTEKCTSVIEDVIRQYPEQWFMFREFWKEDANKV